MEKWKRFTLTAGSIILKIIDDSYCSWVSFLGVEQKKPVEEDKADKDRAVCVCALLRHSVSREPWHVFKIVLHSCSINRLIPLLKQVERSLKTPCSPIEHFAQLPPLIGDINDARSWKKSSTGNAQRTFRTGFSFHAKLKKQKIEQQKRRSFFFFLLSWTQEAWPKHYLWFI